MFKTVRPEVLGVFLLAATQLTFAGPDVLSSAQNDPAVKAKAVALYSRMPLAFELNEGQTSSEVKAFSRGSGYGLFLTSNESVVVLTPKAGESTAIRTKIIGAKTAIVVPADKLNGTLNSFIGNDRSKWRTNIATYSKVKYEGIYSGVDLVYYGNQQQLEYDFIVAPGADPNIIRLGISGADIRIDSNGDLVMHTSLGDVRHNKPVIYQEVGGARHEIAGRFVKLAADEVGFAIADYDRHNTLVIDPSFIFSTYLGGSGSDQAVSVQVDVLGNTFIAGTTTSTNYPTNGSEPGPYPVYPGGATDAFFSVIFFQANAAGNFGSTLFISSYYGGTTGNTSINAIDILQGSGQLIPTVYIAGWSSATDLPTVNPLQHGYGGGSSDGFVAQLKYPNFLQYASYVGGSDTDAADENKRVKFGGIRVG
jgi:hypothetical protein